MESTTAKSYLCRWCENEPKFETQILLVDHLTNVHNIHQLGIFDYSVHEHPISPSAINPIVDGPQAVAISSPILTAGAFAGAQFVENQFSELHNTLRDFMVRGIKIGIAAALDCLQQRSPEGNSSVNYTVLAETSASSTSEDEPSATE